MEHTTSDVQIQRNNECVSYEEQGAAPNDHSKELFKLS